MIRAAQCGVCGETVSLEVGRLAACSCGRTVAGLGPSEDFAEKDYPVYYAAPGDTLFFDERDLPWETDEISLGRQLASTRVFTLADRDVPDDACLLRAAIRCTACGEMLESTHRHDFRQCTCGGCSIDGGGAYRRVLGTGGEQADRYVAVKAAPASL